MIRSLSVPGPKRRPSLKSPRRSVDDQLYESNGMELPEGLGSPAVVRKVEHGIALEVEAPVKVIPLEIYKDFWLAFWCVLLARMIAALTCPIVDCDETFNYWDPMHYMVYGFGFQTWEYAPQYGLRSYLYTGVHAVVAKAIGTSFRVLQAVLSMIEISLEVREKIFVFYGLRIVLGCWNALSSAFFIHAVCKKFSFSKPGYDSLVVAFVFSPGFFISGASFLPQSFALNCLMMAHGYWISGHAFYHLAMWWMGIAVVVGCWPFAAIIMIPMVMGMVFVFYFFNAGIAFSQSLIKSILFSIPIFLLLGFSTLVDAHYYGKVLFPLWNLFFYNSTNGGPELYGVEDFTFYLKNLALNFSLLLPFALLGILQWKSFPLLSGGMLWLVFMFSMAHKEERFLYPIYHLLVLSGVFLLRRISFRFLRELILLGFVVFSCSRSLALYAYYSAPLRVFAHVPGPFCIGKEWYRYPSAFHVEVLPRFIPSNFHGQLPQPYTSSSELRSGFNDRNREELNRYAKISECELIVDLQMTEKYDGYDVMYEEVFLDASRSWILTRAFYIPWLSSTRNHFSNYQILQKKKS